MHVMTLKMALGVKLKDWLSRGAATTNAVVPSLGIPPAGLRGALGPEGVQNALNV